MSRYLVLLATCIGALGLGITVPHRLFAESPAAMDTAAIEQATGLKGAFNKEENVFKVSKPRSDVAIKVDD